VSFTLRRTSGIAELTLTREHERLVTPPKGPVDWASFDRAAFTPAQLQQAASDWHARAFTEFHSLTHFTQLASQLQRLGAPLDWSGAMLRMATDEARHADLCLRFTALVGGPETLDTSAEALTRSEAGPLLDVVRRDVLATFCVAETLSVRMFRRCLQAATVPLAKDVVQAILVDETLHAEAGWELGALLMRDAPPATTLADELLEIFRAVARQCHATGGREQALAQAEFDERENFGTLTTAGYARAFFEGMEADVVPGLEAIGVTDAPALWARFLVHPVARAQ
jgi:hypothetical protein